MIQLNKDEQYIWFESYNKHVIVKYRGIYNQDTYVFTYEKYNNNVMLSEDNVNKFIFPYNERTLKLIKIKEIK